MSRENLMVQIGEVRQLVTRGQASIGDVVALLGEIAEALDGRERVLSLTEALDAEYCYLEVRETGRVPIVSLGMPNGKGEVLVYRFRAAPNVAQQEEYGVEWRCWDQRPSEARRKAVAWKD